MEHWRKIKDFDNYEVSTEGRIRNRRTGKIKTQYKIPDRPIYTSTFME